MKTNPLFFGLAVLLLGGCVAAPYYDAYPQHYPYQAAPQAQYAPQQVAPTFVGCRPYYVPSWNGCVLPIWPQYIAPMYTGGYYGAPMVYTDPFLSFRFNFNFGKGGKHHGGGRHHHGR